MKRTLILALVVLVLFPFFSFSQASIKGMTIAVALRSLPETDYFVPMISQFEAATGAKVKVIQYPEQQLRDKIVEDLSTGAGQFDVVALDSFSMPQFAAAKWLIPLDTTIQPGDQIKYDVNDISKGVRDLLSFNGHLYALPVYAETSQLMYRKDLFKADGIAVPQTIDELIAAAKHFTNKSTGQYGIAMRGLRGFGMNMYIFAGFLHAFGGDFFTQDYKPKFANKAGLKAGGIYSQLLREYGPPGEANFSWDDVQNAFTTGKVAMIIDANNFYTRIEDPSKSTIVGKIGYAKVPRGPNGSYPSIYSLGFGVSSVGAKKSVEQQAAIQFILWATSYDMQVGEISKGIVSQTRDKVLNSKEFVSHSNADWLSSTAESMKIVKGNYLPPSEAYPPVGDIVGVALQSVISGEKQIKDAFDGATSEAATYLKGVKLYGTKAGFAPMF